MSTSERPSARFAMQQENQWRSVIRIFAVVAAILGLVLVGNEIFENVTCNGAAFCAKIHLGTMMWGLVFLCLGLLILQKGDVSLSLREAAETGTVVRSWFVRGGRQTDAPGTKVVTEVATPKDPEPKP